MMIKTILKTGCAVALLISAIPAVALDPFRFIGQMLQRIVSIKISERVS